MIRYEGVAVGSVEAVGEDVLRGELSVTALISGDDVTVCVGMGVLVGGDSVSMPVAVKSDVATISEFVGSESLAQPTLNKIQRHIIVATEQA